MLPRDASAATPALALSAAIGSGRESAWRRTLVSALSDRVPPGTLDDVVIVAGELVANAVVHGRPPVTLTAEVDEATVLVEVWDAGRPVHLSPGHAEPEALSGRGLEMVDSLASSWGVRAEHGGKAVWASVRTGGQENARADPPPAAGRRRA